MKPRPNLVLVTGGTGHLGARIIDELLKANYSVRATARPHKVDTLRKTYPGADGKLDVVEMADLIADAGDWPKILKGVDAVIHVACPVFHPGVTATAIYTAANEGTQKLLDAVMDPQSSVTRFVLTGSTGVFFNPDFSSIMDDTTYDHNTYSDIESIDPEKHTPSYGYIASKITSEKLIWKAEQKMKAEQESKANEFPRIEFTSILPSTVYGWFLKDYPVPKTISEFNANKFLYGLIPPSDQFPSFPTYPLRTVVHNQDVAKAHVLALTAPAPPDGQRRRFIVSQGMMSWVDAIEFLQQPETITKFKARLRELKASERTVSNGIVPRLPDVKDAMQMSKFNLDSSLTESVLGMKASDYIPWQETLLEVMPELLAWEETHQDALHPEPS
ncbi:hypothetical protein B0H15DRAFT_841179 [Mycena belliarum]|uniref:NAD-dependent epimerase/dehydratase domain-containing protein n=1 Tax=Mycena belliarum TaxID=1033014 RepID=A0AAD6U2L1_9AGAR|nr:hypothetical protein B0H15DRAFT_841179 [Mycena belliae]